MAGPPDILVSTPACLQSCFSKGVLLPASVQDSLSFLVLDEVIQLGFTYRIIVLAIMSFSSILVDLILMGNNYFIIGDSITL